MMLPMKRYTGIICDLLGTLVPNHSAVAARAVLVAMANPLGVAEDLHLDVAGLDAVQIVRKLEDDDTACLVNRTAWSGAKISSIAQLVETIGPAA